VRVYHCSAYYKSCSRGGRMVVVFGSDLVCFYSNRTIQTRIFLYDQTLNSRARKFRREWVLYVCFTVAGEILCGNSVLLHSGLSKASKLAEQEGSISHRSQSCVLQTGAAPSRSAKCMKNQRCPAGVCAMCTGQTKGRISEIRLPLFSVHCAGHRPSASPSA